VKIGHKQWCWWGFGAVGATAGATLLSVGFWVVILDGNKW
jgi:hypothetical protein